MAVIIGLACLLFIVGFIFSGGNGETALVFVVGAFVLFGGLFFLAILSKAF